MEHSNNEFIKQSHWYQHFIFQLIAAFLIGATDGFLYRPLEPYSSLRTPAPPALSLWGLWQVPVCLLFSLMVVKTIYVLIRQKKLRSSYKVAIHVILLIFYLLLFVWGIAPEEQLKQFHLYSDSYQILYRLLNPFMVGLATAIIFYGNTITSYVVGKAILISCFAWAGTAALFLVLVRIYSQVTVRLPVSCFHWFCNNSDPTPIIFNTAPYWIMVGMIIALFGGLTGMMFTYMLLETR